MQGNSSCRCGCPSGVAPAPTTRFRAGGGSWGQAAARRGGGAVAAPTLVAWQHQKDGPGDADGMRPGASCPGRGCNAPDTGLTPQPHGEFLWRSPAQNGPRGLRVLGRERTPVKTECGALSAALRERWGRGCAWPLGSLAWVDREISHTLKVFLLERHVL